MHTPVKMLFNNTYHVELIDSSTGKVKQQGDFHNLTTDLIGSVFIGAALSSTDSAADGDRGLLFQIRVGSGTTAPSTSDTSLESELWSAEVTLQDGEWINDYTRRRTASVTFPATSAYVGNVTEVCIYSSNASSTYSSNAHLMVTRSLLTDSEGQQISFNKTDTDILTVTVTMELSLTSAENAFEIFKQPYFVSHKLGKGSSYNNTFNTVYGPMNLCRFYYTLDNFYKSNASINVDLAVSSTTVLSGGNGATSRSGYIKYPSVRVGTSTITSERYYKGIAIPSIGFWKLPNEDVFPAYTISDISIGVGDGTTTDFINPLCYFKKNTDKVYKNGVQLVRGTDYTINNVGNAKCLPEVAELTTPSTVHSNATSTTTLSDWVPLFIPTTANAPGPGTKFLSNASPLYIEYEEDTTFNCLACVGKWYAPSGTNGYNNVSSSTIVYLDYSVDGTVYEEVGQANIADSFNIDFETKTAKYWRLRTSSTSTIGMRFTTSGTTTDSYMMLNFKDPYIKFAEPPASGDVLTMDVDMDIIMKNENFVIDVGAQLDITW